MDRFGGWSLPLVVVIVLAIVLMLAAAIWYFIRFLRTFKLAHDELMPLGPKLAFWGTLIYLFSPIDILPDPILIDDITALIVASRYITNLAAGFGLGPGSTESAGIDPAGAGNPIEVDGYLRPPPDYET